MDGFLEEVNFEQRFKGITKRKMKGWCWEVVAVFHVQKECVCRHRDDKN